MQLYFIGDKTEKIYTDRLYPVNDRRFGNVYILSRPLELGNKPVGYLLLNFLATDLTKLSSFIEWVNTCGLSGLVKYSNTAVKLGEREPTNPCTKNEYPVLMEQIWKESRESLQIFQKGFKELFYQCLDMNGPDWASGLSPIKRYYVMLKSHPDTKQLSSLLNRPQITSFTVLPTGMGLEDDFVPINFTLSPEILANNIKSQNFEMIEILESNDLLDICVAEFKQMLKIGQAVKKCGYCKEYFIPTNRIDTKYCDRILDDKGHTCKDIGPMTNYLQEAEDNPALRAYRSSYKRMHARLKAKKEEKRITKAELDTWRIKAKNKWNEMCNGTLSLEDFIEWTKTGKE